MSTTFLRVLVDPDDLVDSQQVADMLGLASRRAITTYRARYPTFPEPVLVRERCIFWRRQDIEAWAARRR